MFDETFIKQVELLLQCMPVLRNHSCFAIKGGTAINLFIQNMPRLSVDIDLTYFALDEREKSLATMQSALHEMAEKIQKIKPNVLVKKIYTNQNNLLTKLLIYHENSMVKIEANYIMRGTVFPNEKGTLSKRVNELFNAYIDEIPLLSNADLYAGKICAALNRQHPRDLFDIRLLLNNEGITDSIRKAFVVYVACNPRPIHELLMPNRLNIDADFNREFKGMTDFAVTKNELIEARENLIKEISNSLTDNEKQFLLSIKSGNPDFSLMQIPHLEALPALQWKIINVNRMNSKKRKLMADKLKKVLNL